MVWPARHIAPASGREVGKGRDLDSGAACLGVQPGSLCSPACDTGSS